MSTSKDQVLKLLSKVIDPVTKLNIVSLGIVSHILIDEKNNNIKFALEIEKETLKQRAHLVTECKKILESIDGINKVIIAITNTAQIIRKTILVASGKGGVGKSTIALNIAVGLAEKGCKVAIVDADIYGPSIPHMLGVTDKPKTVNGKIIPLEKYGIKSISIGYFLDPGDAVVWRGPMLTKSLQQIILNTVWGNLDYMIIDTPPGTGDVHITLSKICKISSAIIISTPQKLANIDAVKAIDMFEKLKIPITGIVENMSYLLEAKTKFLFGRSGAKKLAEERSIKFLGEIPLEPDICYASDSGIPAIFDAKIMQHFSQILDSITRKY